MTSQLNWVTESANQCTLYSGSVTMTSLWRNNQSLYIMVSSTRVKTSVAYVTFGKRRTLVNYISHSQDRIVFWGDSQTICVWHKIVSLMFVLDLDGRVQEKLDSGVWALFLTETDVLEVRSWHLFLTETDEVFKRAHQGKDVLSVVRSMGH